MNKVMCNWNCDVETCPHKFPHLPMVGREPQCQSKGTYCYSKNQNVNCVPVKEEELEV